MKKLSVCISVMSLVLITVGCGKRNRSTEMEGEAAGAAAIELTLWHIMNYAGPREVISAAVKRFEEANPGTSVKVEMFDNDAYKMKLAVEMASGTPPDVLFTWGGGTLQEFAEAGRVLDLSEFVDSVQGRERFMPAALDLCTVNGDVYALPLDLSAVVLWYNAELFAEHSLQPPRTYDEFLHLCGTFRAKGITPCALGNRDQWPGAFYFIYLAARQGGVPLFLQAASNSAGKRFDDPAFVEAGAKLQKLTAVNAFSTGHNGLDVGQARAQFLTGQAAMYLMGNWLVARIKTEKPEFLQKLELQPFPHIGGGQGAPDTVVGGVNCAFAVSADCANPDKAMELLHFLTDDVTARAWCKIGRIPAIRVSEEALAELPDPTRRTFELLNAAQYLQPYYDQHLPPRLAEVHKKTTQELFAGTINATQAAERMAAAAANPE